MAAARSKLGVFQMFLPNPRAQIRREVYSILLMDRINLDVAPGEPPLR